MEGERDDKAVLEYLKWRGFTKTELAFKEERDRRASRRESERVAEMAGAEVDKKVLAYLRRKGFKQAELAFQEEQQQNTGKSSSNSLVDRDFVTRILSLSSELEIEGLEANDRDTVASAYSYLKSWTLGSPDMYKVELIEVLYQVFILCFMDLVDNDIEEAGNFFRKFQEDHVMMHSQDLKKFEVFLSPMDVEEVEFVHSLRSKANVKICQNSYEHLFQHLRKWESTMMFELINKHIHFQVSAGQHCSISETNKIFVGGLPLSIDEDRFKNIFSNYGKVLRHELIRDHNTGCSRRFGFITFDNDQSVKYLVGRRINIEGAMVEIKKSIPKKT